MSSIRRFLLIALLLLLVGAPVLAQSGDGQVRFVHAIPGASTIDIYTDGTLTISDLAYGNATNYITVPAGSHHLAVTQTGSTTSLWEQDINPAADSAQTLVASSASQAAFQVYQDDLNSLPLGKARFTAIHAIADGPSVDVILADGRPVIPGLQYNQPYGTLDLPATSYALAVVPAGQPLSAAILPAQPYNLASGTSYVALVFGTSDAPKALLLSAPTRPEGPGGFVRVAHVIPDAPAVDIYLNNTLVAPGLDFGSTTDYIALPAASYTLAARAAGSSTDLATGTLDVSADGMETVLVTGSAEAPAVQVFEDVTSAVNAGTSVLSLMNVTTDADVTAAYSDGSALLSSISSGTSNSALLQPSESSIVVSTTGGDTTNAKTLDLPGGIYGGVYYGVIVAGNTPQVIQLPSVSLAQGIASAPGDQAMAASQPTAAPTEVAQVPQIEPTATLAPVTQPTQDAGVEILIPPTPAETTEGPTARVLVDPGVNLQLRQYPNSIALSLGLAPSGATLHVNGRAGDPVPAPGTTATPTPDGATPSVDPITLLQPGEDLDPRQTWLNVTFDTPDGGTITAWVNALYVGLHDSQGKSLALRNLATVPSNKAGIAQNTAIQPPSPQEYVTYAIATNVSPGVRIHIRRIPDTAGESLALIPAGTQAEFVGVTDARDWVFIRYTSPDSTVTGWVSIEFVTFQRNGLSVDFDRLQELNELTILDGTQRGAVTSTGQPTAGIAPDLRNVVAGTVIGLNADANLHLRRIASEQGESLALLPNGTTLVVTGRTEDSVWLQVTYQNQTGWVSSEYVQLTFNGQPYDIATLSAISTPTPTASPTTQG